MTEISNMSRIERLMASRVAERRVEATGRAEAACSRLRALGVDVVVTGSLADGSFAVHSDVDLLVLDEAGISAGRILREVEDAMDGFPFDLVWLAHLRPEVAATMLEKAFGCVPMSRGNLMFEA